MLEMVKARQIPTILFVNGVNKENSNFVETVRAIREKFSNVANSVKGGPEMETVKVNSFGFKYSLGSKPAL